MKRLVLALLGLLMANCALGAAIRNPDKTEFKSKRVVHITQDIDWRLVKKFKEEYAKVRDLPGDLWVVINSYGGSVAAGMEIAKVLYGEQRAGNRVVCVAQNAVVSMAFNLYTHCDVKVATAKTYFLFHRLRYANLDGGPPLTARNIRLAALELDKLDALFDSGNAEALHMTPEVYSLHADQETPWNERKLRDLGYVDQIVEYAE